MKLLLVADKEERSLWDYYTKDKTEGVNLILSCGDLDPDYLQFLTTMVNRPLLYVRGNHDGVYDRRPPSGCDDIDDEVFNYHGLRILGLGGSFRYRDSEDMYTEEEMAKRIRKLSGTLSYTGGFDILLTHAPAAGYGDMEDMPHRGFECFNALLEKWKPAYMIHGHVHQEYGDFQRSCEHSSGTKIINACGHVMIDISQDEYPEEGKTGSAFYDWQIIRRRKRSH
ncbi:MAG: metallophosphoesterase [Erysipelotrichia bacterium]|nr:metallophosphoesterase [Erysipelotrichia bacterium]